MSSERQSFDDLRAELKDLPWLADSDENATVVDTVRLRDPDVAWKLPFFSLRFLFHSQGIALGRIIHIVGPEKACKSSLCMDLARHFIDSGGLVIYIETEGKLDKEKMLAFLRGWCEDDFDEQVTEDRLSKIVIYQATSIEAWQKILVSVFTKLQDTTYPVLFVIDSLRGTAGEDAITRVEKSGYVERAAPIEALKIMKFLEVIRPYFLNRPYLMLIVNHMKVFRSLGDAYRPWVSVGGGKSIAFFASWRLDIEKQEQNTRNIDEKSIDVCITMADSNLCQTGHFITVPVIHTWRKSSTGQTLHCAYYDWPWTTVDLLIRGLSVNKVKVYVKEQGGIAVVKGQYNRDCLVSQVLFGDENKRSFHEAGLLLETVGSKFLRELENMLHFNEVVEYRATGQ
jgi:RecA/RadA recombinase